MYILIYIFFNTAITTTTTITTTTIYYNHYIIDIDVNAKNDKGYTLLMYLCSDEYDSNISVVKTLLKHSTIDITIAHPVHIHPTTERIENCRGEIHIIHEGYPGGMTALHFACREGSLSVLQELLYLYKRQDLDVNMMSSEGTPLMCAITHEFTREINKIHLLLDQFPSITQHINVCDWEGNSVLMHAIGTYSLSLSLSLSLCVCIYIYICIFTNLSLSLSRCLLSIWSYCYETAPSNTKY